MERKDLARALLEAAYALDERRLWERFASVDCFGIRIPEQDETILVSVVGATGDLHGLALFRGPGAVGSLAAALDPQGPGDDASAEMDTLQVLMEPFKALGPADRTLIHEAGIDSNRHEQFPCFVAKPPHCEPRSLNESEMRLLQQVFEAIREADVGGLLHPARLDDEEGICTLNVNTQGDAIGVDVTRRRWEQEPRAVTIPVHAGRYDLSGLPRLEATWMVGLPCSANKREPEDDRAVQMLLVADDDRTMLLQRRSIHSGDWQEAVKAVVETFEGNGLTDTRGLPQEIAFSSRRLYDAMTPILTPLGVECRYEATIPTLHVIASILSKNPKGDLSASDLASILLGDDDSPTPAPDDTSGWRRAETRLIRRFGERFAAALSSDTSGHDMRRYFGDDNPLDLIKAYRSEGIAEAFFTWKMLDYRPKKSSQTDAEKALEKGLPEAEAIVLRARMESYPSLYRVLDRDVEAKTLELEDILLGGTVTAREPLTRQGIEESKCIAARLFLLGNTRFTALVGPILDADMEADAVEFLQELEVEFTPDGLRRDVHQFGRLWAWMDEWLGGTIPLEDVFDMPDYVEVSPDIASSLQELTNRQYMDWLDERHPSLGETPRQACRVESGRREVARLIRAIPEPDGPVDVQIPRQTMMRELGLDEEASLDRPEKKGRDERPIPIRTVAPKPKVARNAPCPCGSGHKYKKCCGRLHSH